MYRRFEQLATFSASHVVLTMKRALKTKNFDVEQTDSLNIDRKRARHYLGILLNYYCSGNALSGNTTTNAR